MTNTRKPICLSLFAGGGGCSLGFKQAGFNILYAVDLDVSSCKTYTQNFPGTEVENADITSLNWRTMLAEHGLVEGEVDMLIGGPPCQGFSTAGKRFWDDPRNHLLKSYIDALRVMRPRWFMMENVEGLLTMKKGEYLSHVVGAFVKLGYKLRLEKVYAHEYGVPQRRKRVFIIGNRLGWDFSFPAPTTPIGGAIFRTSPNTIESALRGLPVARAVSSPSQAKGRLPQGHFYIPQTGINLERIQRLQPGQTMKDLPDDLQHESFKRRAFRRVMDGMPSEKRGGAPSGLKRLIASEPALTITSASTREFVHPTEDRCLTIRECARIQTFPDSFEFCGSAADQIKQIGNAIPPLLARTFAEYIMDQSHQSPSDPEQQGGLLGFSLTKAEAMSPALRRTQSLLESISTQASLFPT